MTEEEKYKERHEKWLWKWYNVNSSDFVYKEKLKNLHKESKECQDKFNKLFNN